MAGGSRGSFGFLRRLGHCSRGQSGSKKSVVSANDIQGNDAMPKIDALVTWNAAAHAKPIGRVFFHDKSGVTLRSKAAPPQLMSRGSSSNKSQWSWPSCAGSHILSGLP